MNEKHPSNPHPLTPFHASPPLRSAFGTLAALPLPAPLTIATNSCGLWVSGNCVGRSSRILPPRLHGLRGRALAHSHPLHTRIPSPCCPHTPPRFVNCASQHSSCACRCSRGSFCHRQGMWSVLFSTLLSQLLSRFLELKSLEGG